MHVKELPASKITTNYTHTASSSNIDCNTTHTPLAEGKEVSSGSGKAICPNVWGLFAWQCDSEGKGSQHCKDRVTANRPQTSLDKRHLSNHTIPLDTFVPCELLQSAAALQPRLVSLGTETINPQDKCRLNTQTPKLTQSHCFNIMLERGWCNFSKGLNESSVTVRLENGAQVLQIGGKSIPQDD